MAAPWQGIGFDVATAAEIDAVAPLLTSSTSLIVSNPCKTKATIEKMVASGFELTVFDTKSELQKLAEWMPGAEVMLRIDAGDDRALSKLGTKYGVPVEEEEMLLLEARSLGVSIVGVMFHIGSEATTPGVFQAAIARARNTFAIGQSLGHPMRILDIGGGFTNGNLPAMATSINSALDRHFADLQHVQFMAEPGRYFAASPMSL